MPAASSTAYLVFVSYLYVVYQSLYHHLVFCAKSIIARKASLHKVTKSGENNSATNLKHSYKNNNRHKIQDFFVFFHQSWLWDVLRKITRCLIRSYVLPICMRSVVLHTYMYSTVLVCGSCWLHRAEMLVLANFTQTKQDLLLLILASLPSIPPSASLHSQLPAMQYECLRCISHGTVSLAHEPITCHINP